MRLSLNGVRTDLSFGARPGSDEFFVSNNGETVLGSTVDGLPSRCGGWSASEYRSLRSAVRPCTSPSPAMPGGLGIDVSTLMMQERDPVTFEPFGPVYGPHRTSEVLTSPDGRWLALSLDPPGDVVGAGSTSVRPGASSPIWTRSRRHEGRHPVTRVQPRQQPIRCRVHGRGSAGSMTRRRGSHWNPC